MRTHTTSSHSYNHHHTTHTHTDQHTTTDTPAYTHTNPTTGERDKDKHKGSSMLHTFVHLTPSWGHTTAKWGRKVKKETNTQAVIADLAPPHSSITVYVVHKRYILLYVLAFVPLPLHLKLILTTYTCIHMHRTCLLTASPPSLSSFPASLVSPFIISSSSAAQRTKQQPPLPLRPKHTHTHTQQPSINHGLYE